MDGENWCREECYQIQGAVFDLYREMGCSFLAAGYYKYMEKELSKRDILSVEHQELKLFYFGCYPKATVEQIVLH